FRRYQPDFLISVFNQFFLVAITVMSFFLAGRLFDLRTAIVSSSLLLGTELLWRFAISGLATLVLLLIFMCLVWCLVHLEERVYEPGASAGTTDLASGGSSLRTEAGAKAGGIEPPPRIVAALALAALAGALVGLGALTRYPFGWLILPVVAFVSALSGRGYRLAFGLATFLPFLVIFAPWLIRNYQLSGTPFGTASYAVLEGTIF